MQTKQTRYARTLRALAVALWGVIAVVATGAIEVEAAASKSAQQSFASPEEGFKALADAVAVHDRKVVGKLLGPANVKLLSSGDPVADRNTGERFSAHYQEGNKVVMQGDAKAILLLGKNEWPLPFPLVKHDDGWRFDGAAAEQEIIDRRVGRNELFTIQTVLAIADAQQDYAAKDRNGDGLLAYAQKFRSSPGKRDGLYWETKAGEEQSPLGPLAAQATREGYLKSATGKPEPYHGYFFRILTGQGKGAPGGAYDYIVRKEMIGGFAVLAYPAKYGSSGVMSFITNHDGVVYQKDLGPKTATVAASIKRFDPSDGWAKVEQQQ
jgi:hypothetical protein